MASVFIFASAFVGPSVTEAWPASPEEKLKSITIFKGSCRLELFKGFFPCEPAVGWFEKKEGGAFLTFIKKENNETTIFSVSGKADRQPNLENYYIQIDTFRVYKGGVVQAEDTNMEGECHFQLSSDAKKFYSIKCDIYDRSKPGGVIFKFYLEEIVSFERNVVE